MFKEVEISMKKVAIVSCDKWVNRLEEDNNLILGKISKELYFRPILI